MAHIPHIRAVSDLRNHFKEVTELAQRSNEPIFLTKNGKGALVVMSMEAYEKEQYASEVYLKLKEAELEAKSGAPRVSHKQVMAELAALMDAPDEHL